MRRGSTHCPAQATLKVIGGPWKVPILFYLARGTQRFGELRRLLGTITPRMLTHQLRALEREGIIKRKIYLQVPPKVEYSLTARGKTLLPIVSEMCRWAKGRKC
jgi:DNA-binding HxlR family transcriptional regulator